MKIVKKEFSLKSQGRQLRKDLVINKEIYFMLIPVVAFYIIFHYMPMYGALIAFKDYAPKLGVMASPWAGLKHFELFFSSPSFMTVLLNTLRISFLSLLIEFPAPIILAVLINELRSNKFAKVVQTATYLPHFISLIVVCGMVKDFTRDTGIITQLLGVFGVPEVSLLGYPEYFLPVYRFKHLAAGRLELYHISRGTYRSGSTAVRSGKDRRCQQVAADDSCNAGWYYAHNRYYVDS